MKEFGVWLKEVSKQFVYLGNCVTGLDTGALSQIGIDNASDMARKLENAREISKSVFYSAVGEIPSEVRNLTQDHYKSYFYDEDDGFYVLYDEDEDIHYFFG